MPSGRGGRRRGGAGAVAVGVVCVRNDGGVAMGLVAHWGSCRGGSRCVDRRCGVTSAVGGEPRHAICDWGYASVGAATDSSCQVGLSIQVGFSWFLTRSVPVFDFGRHGLMLETAVQTNSQRARKAREQKLPKGRHVKLITCTTHTHSSFEQNRVTGYKTVRDRDTRSLEAFCPSRIDREKNVYGLRGSSIKRKYRDMCDALF